MKTVLLFALVFSFNAYSQATSFSFKVAEGNFKKWSAPKTKELLGVWRLVGEATDANSRMDTSGIKNQDKSFFKSLLFYNAPKAFSTSSTKDVFFHVGNLGKQKNDLTGRVQMTTLGAKFKRNMFTTGGGFSGELKYYNCKISPNADELLCEGSYLEGIFVTKMVVGNYYLYYRDCGQTATAGSPFGSAAGQTCKMTKSPSAPTATKATSPNTGNNSNTKNTPFPDPNKTPFSNKQPPVVKKDPAKKKPKWDDDLE